MAGNWLSFEVMETTKGTQYFEVPASNDKGLLTPISLSDTLTHLLTLNRPDLRSTGDLCSFQVLLSTPVQEVIKITYFPYVCLHRNVEQNNILCSLTHPNLMN